MPAAEKNVHWIEVEYYDGLYNSNIEFSIEPYKVADTGWIGELYSNTSLSGVPVILGGENALEPIQNLNFDWGAQSPHPFIPRDNFSARFLRKINVSNEGYYRFNLAADDGIRLIVNGKKIIDSWIDSNSIRDGFVYLPKGQHEIIVEYYERAGNAKLNLNFELTDYVFVRKEETVGMNWGMGSPGEGISSDGFSAVFDQSRFFERGDYFVQTLADDGVKVEVDGKYLIDRWSDSSGNIDRSLWLNVPRDHHSIITHYYENSGNAFIFSDIVPLGDWVAYYYSDKNIGGSPVTSKVISSPSSKLSFAENNGSGSPVPNKVSTDNFSAKYSTAARLKEGSYIIRTKADDGVRVYLDGELILDRWSNSSLREDSILVNISDRKNVSSNEANIHWIEVDYFENTGQSSIEFEIVPFNQTDYQNQWIGFVYPNKNLTGNPVVLGGDNSLYPITNLNFNWKNGSPSPMVSSDGFSVRFKKREYFDKGTYTIYAHSDDGVRVKVDGQVVIDSWYNAGVNGIEKYVNIPLNSGYHDLEVEYFENIGDAYINLSISKSTDFRVPNRPAPYGPDFYEVSNGILYHYLGTPENRTAKIYVSPAPSFLKEGKVYVKDSEDKFYERTPFSDVYVGNYLPPYKGLDLRLPSTVTAQQIDSYIKSIVPESPLIGYGAAYVEAQKKYGVNALYLVAHSLVESNWGRSNIAKYKHNLFGFGAYDSCPFECAYYFPSFTESIYYTAYYIRTNYLDSNGKWYGGSPTLKGMNVRYATDLDWAEKIAGLMQRIKGYNSSEYQNVSVLPITDGPPPAPGRDIPNGGEFTVYPAGVKGLTTTRVNFRTDPVVSSQTYIRTLDENTDLEVLGTNNQGWYKVKIGSEQGWISSEYVNVLNLLKVNISSGNLNIRSEPSTNSSIVGSLSKDSFVEAALENNNYVLSNGWYKVKIPSTSYYGWVSGELVVQVGRR
ncbi:PA14 domain-containing protein [Bacillus kexueae]|uniref:PA14 domain-containing protein n=1 Tax=Aeribacillus kexueae TaxID=2078952 RepID=UPI001FAEB781